MALGYVRTESSPSGGSSTASSITLTSAPPSGRLLLARVMSNNTTDARTTQGGWTKIVETTGGGVYNGLFGKIAGSGEGATQTPCTTPTARNYITTVHELSGTFGASVAAIVEGSGATTDADATKTTTNSVNPTDGVERLVLGAAAGDVRTHTWSSHKLNGSATHNGVAVAERSDLGHSSGAVSGTTFTWIGTTVAGNYTVEAVASGVNDGNILLAVVKESIVTLERSASAAFAFGGSASGQQLSGGGAVVEATAAAAFGFGGSATPALGASADLILTFSGSAVGEQAVSFAATSRVALRQALARRLAALEIITVSEAASGADAARTLISDDLIDHEKSAGAYRGWAYCIRGTLVGRQARIHSHGYSGTAGSILLAAPLNDVSQGGDQWELHTLLPADDADGLAGLNRLLNEALGKLWVIDRLPITGDGTASYALAAYPWLTLDEQVVGVEWSPVAGYAPSARPGGGMVQYDAEIATLRLRAPVPAGQAFEALVHRPANTRIRSGGTWSDSTLGLASDSDEAPLPPGPIVEVAFYLALRQIVDRLRSSQDVSRWVAQLALQAHVVNGIFNEALPHRDRSLGVGGPVHSAWPKGLF